LGPVLITGATGQIGSFLCQEFATRGEDVLACDIKPSLANIASSASRLSVEAVDVTDYGRLLEVAKAHRPDSLVHLAAVVFLESMKNPGLAYRVNILGTNNVMEVARVLDIKKVVFASSVLVYGNVKTRREGAADEEDHPSPPPDPYSTSKLACELMGRYYLEKYGMDISCLRIAAAWGPGRYTGYTGQFNEYVRRVATGQDATFPPDFAFSKARLRWLYVKDVSNAFAHVAQSRKPRSYLFNTGSRTPFKATDVVAALKSILPGTSLGVQETEEPTQLSAAAAGPNGLDIDCSRLYDELGFSPKFTLPTALKDMVDFEKARATSQSPKAEAA
jgi:UDP-glucose 4-epimerase